MTSLLLTSPAADLSFAQAPILDTAVRIYLGRGIPSGGVVTDAQLEDFVDSTVAYLFPDGFTVTQGQGGWADVATCETIQEPSVIVEVVVNWASQKDRVRALATAWKSKWAQDAVMVTRSAVSVDFI